MYSPRTSALILIALLAFPSASARAESPDTAAKEALAPLTAAYENARKTQFGEGADVEILGELVNEYLATWKDKAPAEVYATARTYHVRWLLCEGEIQKAHDESGEVLATEGIDAEDTWKLLYYRGMTGVQLGKEEVAKECQAKLKPLKADVAGGLLGAIAQKWPLVQVGKLPPQWELARVSSDAAGGTEGLLKLEDLRGKYVLLDYWATWCPPCVQIMAAELAPLHKQYADEDRFMLISVGTNWRGDTAAKQAAFTKAKGYEWTKVFDATGEVTASYGVQGIPTLTLIGPDGMVIAHGNQEVLAKAKDVLAKLPAKVER